MLVFGDETHSHFLVIGQAVDDVRLAQNMAQMNDVILSPNCWQLCDRSMIETESIPDQRAVKVGVMPLLAEKFCQPVTEAPCQNSRWARWFHKAPGLEIGMASVWVRLRTL